MYLCIHSFDQWGSADNTSKELINRLYVKAIKAAEYITSALQLLGHK